MSGVAHITVGRLLLYPLLCLCCLSGLRVAFSDCWPYPGCPGSIIRYSRPKFLSGPRETAFSFALKLPIRASTPPRSGRHSSSSARSELRRCAREEGLWNGVRVPDDCPGGL